MEAVGFMLWHTNLHVERAEVVDFSFEVLTLRQLKLDFRVAHLRL